MSSASTIEGLGRFGVVAAAAVFDRRVTPAVLRVLCALAVHSPPREWFPLRHRTLADELELSVDQVRRLIAQLVSLGYVETRSQYRDDGSQRSNLYRLRYDLTEPCAETAYPPSVNSAQAPSVNTADPRTDLREQTLENTHTRDFESWWTPWPRKVDKSAAKKKYIARRREGVSAEELAKARDNYLPTVRDVNFCKHGATFLGPDTWREWLDPPSDGKLPQRQQGSKWDRIAEAATRRQTPDGPHTAA